MSLFTKIRMYAFAGGLATALLFPAAALSQGNRSPAAAAQVQESSRVLNVNGQTRGLSMLPASKRDKDKLEFGKARTSYKDKVPATIF